MGRLKKMLIRTIEVWEHGLGLEMTNAMAEACDDV